jgi:hypothetical protein
MAEEETKATEKKEEAQTPPKAQVTPPPTGPGGALEEIQKRAVGGKVAVLEKGDKEPKIVGGNGEGETPPEAEADGKTDGEAKEPEPPAASPGIPISPDAAEDLKMVMDEIGQLERQAGQNAIQFHSAMKQIEEKASELRTDFNSIVRRLGKRFNVPQGWVLNLDTMSFVPQQQGAGQTGMPPLQ